MGGGRWQGLQKAKKDYMNGLRYISGCFREMVLQKYLHAICGARKSG